MLRVSAFCVCVAVTIGFISTASRAADDKPAKDKDGWISLFDGKSLDGWKVAENPKSFRVEDGAIVANGDRAHLFYVGPVNDHNFKNFELKAKVMTFPKANAGLYFHTQYQEKGWPSKGYECQINATHSDWKKTGSLYNVEDRKEPGHKDNEWFDYYIKVQGNNIVIKINDKETVNYTEPADLKRPDRQLSSGTFAIQAHDPGSKVLLKDIMAKPLPD
jgi:hypothetical protein